MLVLSRKTGQTIIIETPSGEVIEVQLLQTRGESARIGIKADAAVKVMRSEIYEPVTPGAIARRVAEEIAIREKPPITPVKLMAWGKPV